MPFNLLVARAQNPNARGKRIMNRAYKHLANEFSVHRAVITMLEGNAGYFDPRLLQIEIAMQLITTHTYRQLRERKK